MLLSYTLPASESESLARVLTWGCALLPFRVWSFLFPLADGLLGSSSIFSSASLSVSAFSLSSSLFIVSGEKKIKLQK